jgi:hypothetical protein
VGSVDAGGDGGDAGTGVTEAYDKLLDAARAWRSARIGNTSTCTWPAAQGLIEAVAAFDRPPCDHPRSWWVFSSRSGDADVLCARCASTVVAGFSGHVLPKDHQEPSPERQESIERHPSVGANSSPASSSSPSPSSDPGSPEGVESQPTLSEGIPDE